PFAGVDLDGCRDPDTGELADWAKRVLAELSSYAEVSPSGTGVKVFVLARHELEGNKRPFHSGEVEVYDRGRFFVVTGQPLRGPPGPPGGRLRAERAAGPRLAGRAGRAATQAGRGARGRAAGRAEHGRRGRERRHPPVRRVGDQTRPLHSQRRRPLGR